PAQARTMSCMGFSKPEGLGVRISSRKNWKEASCMWVLDTSVGTRLSYSTKAPLFSRRPRAGAKDSSDATDTRSECTPAPTHVRRPRLGDGRRRPRQCLRARLGARRKPGDCAEAGLLDSAAAALLSVHLSARHPLGRRAGQADVRRVLAGADSHARRRGF